MTGLARRIDPGLRRLRAAAVTVAATLASFGTAALLAHYAGLTTSFVILAVALAVTLGRPGQQGATRQRGLLGLLVVPVIAAGASEVGRQMADHPNLGDTLFVLAAAGTIFLRRFGPRAVRIGTLATLPLITTLIVPAPVVADGGGWAGRAWSALIAVVVLGWVSAAELVAHRFRVLPRPEPVLPVPRPKSSRRLPASTRMAVQMAVALTAAFVVGRTYYPAHWTWVVLTAFIVCSGNRGRGDVLGKGIMRVAGAAAGTLAATALTGVFPPGDRWCVVAIFAVLGVGLWLRQLNYAYWAAAMTAALALLYGYFGQAGSGLLDDRLTEIVVGAVLGIAASWLVLPVRSTDVLRRDLSVALAALADCLGTEASAEHHARFRQAVAALDRPGLTLPLTARRPALVALRRCVAAAPDGLTDAGLADTVTDLRRGLGSRRLPDPAAWSELADRVPG